MLLSARNFGDQNAAEARRRWCEAFRHHEAPASDSWEAVATMAPMRSVVVVPTYQEAGNITRFLPAARTAVPEADVLVVDDGSPDGTGELAEQLAAELGQIKVLHRPGKQGLGTAYREGFRLAVDEGYDVVVHMDADLSHDPAVIPLLLSRIEAGADVVIGSRYLPGGSTPNWPLHRRLLSRWGNRYTAAVLRLPLSDVTSGFRAVRTDVLRAVDPATARAEGYAFLTELARRYVRRGVRIAEVPISFRDRQFGESKMSGRIIVESMTLVTAWAVQDLWSERWARRRRDDDTVSD
jgi:dolichol-phosphate mannosyltransferase